MSEKENEKVKKYTPWVWTLSIAIPVVVAILFLIKIPNVESLTFLPPVYAFINAITAVFLTIAYIAIKRKKIILHERLMKISIALSVIFLVMYVAYHMTSDPTPYGGEGIVRSVYYFILISHVLLSIGIIPLVLVTYVRAISNCLLTTKK